MNEGDVACYFSPSGGGYGDPLERSAEQVLEDVLDDFITPEHAREAYGVVLKVADNGYPWALDAAATENVARLDARLKRELRPVGRGSNHVEKSIWAVSSIYP